MRAIAAEDLKPANCLVNQDSLFEKKRSAVDVNQRVGLLGEDLRFRPFKSNLIGLFLKENVGVSENGVS